MSYYPPTKGEHVGNGELFTPFTKGGIDVGNGELLAPFTKGGFRGIVNSQIAAYLKTLKLLISALSYKHP